MLREGFGVRRLASTKAQTALKLCQRANLSEPCLDGNENDQRQMSEAQAQIAHPRGTQRAAAENGELPKHDKRDDGDVRGKHGIGQRAPVLGRK